MTLEYRIKSVYGEDKTYLVGANGVEGRSAFVAAVQSLTGRKTVTASDRAALETLGVLFVQVV
mgnify:CR=1 FL=1